MNYYYIMFCGYIELRQLLAIEELIMTHNGWEWPRPYSHGKQWNR